MARLYLHKLEILKAGILARQSTAARSEHTEGESRRYPKLVLLWLCLLLVWLATAVTSKSINRSRKTGRPLLCCCSGSDGCRGTPVAASFPRMRMVRFHTSCGDVSLIQRRLRCVDLFGIIRRSSSLPPHFASNGHTLWSAKLVLGFSDAGSVSDAEVTASLAPSMLLVAALLANGETPAPLHKEVGQDTAWAKTAHMEGRHARFSSG